MIPEIVEKKSDIIALCLKYGVEKLIVFGSAAFQSTIREVGDIDLLVRFKAMPPVEYAHNYFSFMATMEDLLGLPIDLLEIKPVENPYLRESIEECKVSIYGTP